MGHTGRMFPAAYSHSEKRASLCQHVGKVGCAVALYKNQVMCINLHLYTVDGVFLAFTGFLKVSLFYHCDEVQVKTTVRIINYMQLCSENTYSTNGFHRGQCAHLYDLNKKKITHSCKQKKLIQTSMNATH